MMHSSQIDPFETDLLMEYDVRKVADMSIEEAKHLLAELTIARIQVTNYIRAKESKTKFSLTDDF